MNFIIRDRVHSEYPDAVRRDLQIDENESLQDHVGKLLEFTITYDASDLGPDIITSQGVISDAGKNLWCEYEIVEMLEPAGVVPRSGKMLIRNIATE